MVAAGMDVARLNFSHGTAEQHAQMAQRVRDAAGRAGRPVAILQDLPGPKLRIGALRDGTADLGVGDNLTFVCNGDSASSATPAHDDHVARLASAVGPGEIMYLLDGSIRLRVTATRAGDGEIDTEVEVGGTVASRQGLNIPGETTTCPRCPRRTSSICASGCRSASTSSRCSFVRRPEDVTFVREHTRMPLIAKIEKPQAVERAEAILKVSDCVMVARGDLGIELPIEQVPIVQKKLLALAGALARPSITATQMLDSMVDLGAADPRRGRRRRQRDPRRHRRGDALAGDGRRRAPGRGDRDDGRRRPSTERERALRPLERDARPPRRARPRRTPSPTAPSRPHASSRLDALIVPTLSGRSARLVSAHRPDVPIFALSPGKETVRRCGLMWGVRAASMRRHEVDRGR